MAPRFPLYLNLENAPCLVVGGGSVATRRVETLMRCGAKVRCIAPAFSEALVALAAAEPMNCGGLELVDRPFRETDIGHWRLAVAATDQKDVNKNVASLCVKSNIPVSVADAPELSSFFFPGLVVRGELSVGICTNGASPSTSKQIREIIEMVLPEDLGDRIAEASR